MYFTAVLLPLQLALSAVVAALRLGIGQFQPAKIIRRITIFGNERGQGSSRYRLAKYRPTNRRAAISHLACAYGIVIEQNGPAISASGERWLASVTTAIPMEVHCRDNLGRQGTFKVVCASCAFPVSDSLPYMYRRRFPALHRFSEYCRKG
jgi:hypothetical protein